MGHHIAAVITQENFDKKKAEYYDLTYFVENNFFIIDTFFCANVNTRSIYSIC